MKVETGMDGQHNIHGQMYYEQQKRKAQTDETGMWGMSFSSEYYMVQ
jgi:hypothetical protein